MAYGTPATGDDIEAYYTHIRGGRPPTPALLADLRRRYDAIGGASPLHAIAHAQAEAVADSLGDGFVVELGMKHAPPFIEDGVGRLVHRGADTIVGLVLAPHYSAMSVGDYLDRAGSAALDHDVPFTGVDEWHLDPGYLDFLAGAVSEARSSVGDDAHVVFTAHSLPARIVGEGDVYPEQVTATAFAVAARLDLASWSTAWQSAGRTEDEWLGPDIRDAIRVLASDGVRAVVVCAEGFVADSLEILNDLDIDAAAAATDAGMAFARARMPNADAAFCATLAGIVRGAAAA